MINGVEAVDSLVIAVFVFEEGVFGDQGIRCNILPQHQGPAKAISKEEPVVLKGYCAGYNGTDVILESVH